MFWKEVAVGWGLAVPAPVLEEHFALQGLDEVMRMLEVEDFEDAVARDGPGYSLDLLQSGGVEDDVEVHLAEVVAELAQGWGDWGWDVAGHAPRLALAVAELERRGFEVYLVVARCLLELLDMVSSPQGPHRACRPVLSDRVAIVDGVAVAAAVADQQVAGWHFQALVKVTVVSAALQLASADVQPPLVKVRRIQGPLVLERRWLS